jgi:GNAT superfamily N-acetyltransferase
MSNSHVSISPFVPQDAEAFVQLNLAWLVGHGLLEPADERQLYDPQTHVFDHGGEIFMARVSAEPIGCCAAIPRSDGSMEIAKLAVDRSVRGHGIGRRLVQTALAWGQQRHYTRAVLTSNRKLKTALKLYESVGFRYLPLPRNLPYQTVDVYMELDLTAWSPSMRG